MANRSKWQLRFHSVGYENNPWLALMTFCALQSDRPQLIKNGCNYLHCNNNWNIVSSFNTAAMFEKAMLYVVESIFLKQNCMNDEECTTSAKGLSKRSR